jgi:hypothetical protein
VPGVEGLTGLLLGFVLLAELLKEEVRASAGEGMRWELSLDRRLQMAILGIEAAE